MGVTHEAGNPVFALSPSATVGGLSASAARLPSWLPPGDDIDPVELAKVGQTPIRRLGVIPSSAARSERVPQSHSVKWRQVSMSHRLV